jgi:hypothetical protein
MGHRLALEELSQRCSSPGVVKVAVGEEEQLDLLRHDATGPNIGQQAFMGEAAAGIDERCMTVEMDEVDGGILGLSERASANLEDFISDCYSAHV